MKSSKIRFRFIAFILSSLLFLQSCSIYHSENLSLENAARNGQKTRVVIENGDKLKFNKIQETNDGFFGLTKESSGTSKKLQKLGILGRESGRYYSFGLETLQIDKIQAKNYSASTWATIGISVVGLVAVILVVAAATWTGISPW
ncbi:MAG: hypothetical protein KJO51_08855 [Gramella sp.]|nr:hypothetical protein [Christiangramia sp.]